MADTLTSREIEIALAKAASGFDRVATALSAQFDAVLPGQGPALEATILEAIGPIVAAKLADKMQAEFEALTGKPAHDMPMVISIPHTTATLRSGMYAVETDPAAWLVPRLVEHFDFAHRPDHPTMFAFPGSATWLLLGWLKLGQRVAYRRNSKRGSEAWKFIEDQICEQLAGYDVKRTGGRGAIVLSWGYDGVLVSNTDRHDGRDPGFRAWLGKWRFKFSRPLDAWFLPQSVGFLPPRFPISAMLAEIPNDYRHKVALEGTYADSETTNKRRVEHLLARADTAGARAGKARGAALTAHKASHAISERFSMGQPILVGHHSEARARRDHQKMWDLTGKGVTFQRKAEHLDSKAASIERAAAKVGKSTPEQRRRTIAASVKESGKIQVGDVISWSLNPQPIWVVSVGARNATGVTRDGSLLHEPLERARRLPDAPMPVPGQMYQKGDLVDVSVLSRWQGPRTVTGVRYGGLVLVLDKPVWEQKSVGWASLRPHQPKT